MCNPDHTTPLQSELYPDKRAIIQSISATYSPLSDPCQAEIINNFHLKRLDKNTLLIKEGQFANSIFFIIEGAARAFYLKDGKDISDWFAFEHDFICAINSFFLDVPSPHYIELLEPCTLLEISKSDFERLTNTYHDFERLARVVVTKTMLQLQQRIVAVQFETALQKYENLIALRPDITQRVALSHIASYLGITIETLSRIRKPKSGF